MNRFARGALTVSMLSLGVVLTGCGSYDLTQFDPTAIFDAEIFNTKKKLPGERKPVFPEGTPGVPQGVPQELVKGHQPTGDADASVQSAEAKAAAEGRRQAEGRVGPDRRHGPARAGAGRSAGSASSAAAVPGAVA